MHALALHTARPALGYAYGRAAHARTLAGERPSRRGPTTPVRPSMTSAQRLALAAERWLFLQRNPGWRTPSDRTR